MRRELELLEQIDNYLDGIISKQDLQNLFEEVNDLDTKISQQEVLRSTLKKQAFILKSKASLSKLKFISLVKTIAIVMISIGSASAITFGIIQSQNKTEVEDQIKTAEQKHEFQTSSPTFSGFATPEKEENTTTITNDKQQINLHATINDLSGYWSGTVIQGKQAFEANWEIIKTDSNKYNCTSTIKSNSEYGIMKTVCKVTSGKLKFKEKEILEKETDNSEWCLKKGELSFFNDKNIPQLSGNWSGNCTGGSIDLHMISKLVKKQTPNQISGNTNKEKWISKKNRFNVVTMKNTGNVTRDITSPTNNSEEINLIKGFLNTKEYEVNLKTFTRFRLDVLNANRESILEEYFVELNRKTDATTFRENISISLSVIDNKKLPPGTYFVQMFYWDKLISTKPITVN